MKTGLYLGNDPIGKVIVGQSSTGEEPNLQANKTAIPTKSTQYIAPDEEYDGLSQVTIAPIPAQYITTEVTTAPSADQMQAGTSAYANGNKIDGTLPLVSDEITQAGDDVAVSGSNLIVTLINGIKRIFGIGSSINLQVPLSDMGDATAEDVATGKTFTSSAGLKVTGTHECETGADLSGVTAIQSAILEDNFTYVVGNETPVEGTMSNCSNLNLNVSGDTISIPITGYYEAGQQATVAAATSTIPHATSATLNSDGSVTVGVRYIPTIGYVSSSNEITNTSTIQNVVSTETWTLTDIDGNTSIMTVVNL